MLMALFNSPRFVSLERWLGLLVFLMALLGEAHAQDALKKNTALAGRSTMDQTHSFRGMLFGSSLEEVEKTIKLESISEEHAK
jgi:hypothetical protein